MKTIIKVEGFQTLFEPKKESSSKDEVKVVEDVKVDDKQSTKGA